MAAQTFTDNVFLYSDLYTAVPVTVTYERTIPDEINILSIIDSETGKNVMAKITATSFKRLAETATRITGVLT